MIEPAIALALLVAWSGFALSVRVLQHREGYRQKARRLYANEALGFPWRNSLGVFPIIALLGYLVIVSLLFLRTIVQVLAFGWLVVGDVALVAAYRVPAPFLPAWLRAEISAGTLAVARPSRGDLRWLWFSLVFSALAIAGGFWLLLSGRFAD